ncbi:MAG: exodeoxyribonuclease VII small subunit [Symbiobacterium sp.]|uniref:exodeoxyribonuclease VII small subunit n=1 Tax=Symbiobacterium sp. TaxID=1971213 RepID=UPI003463EFCF
MTENLSFEEAIRRLEQVVKELESGDLPLERGLELFQEGIALTRHCNALLDGAEARIEQLLEQNGETVIAPFEPEE